MTTRVASDLPIFTHAHPQTVEALQRLHEQNEASGNDHHGPLSERDMVQNVLLLAEGINVQVGDLLGWDAQEIRDLWEIMMKGPRMTVHNVMAILNRTSTRVQKFVLTKGVQELAE